MLKLAAIVLDVVQRVLECYLLIRFRVVKGRHWWLHRLKVEEVERVAKPIEETLDARFVDMLCAIERAIYLHALDVA